MPNNLGNALFAWASIFFKQELTVGQEFQFYPICYFVSFVGYFSRSSA
jgi:hypothetical protein